MSTTLIERLNAIIHTGEISRAGLARAAGLHPNSLRKLGQPDWNPTADTLGRLERLIQVGSTEVLVGPEEIINEARNGRMFILVDDEDRENEGDLVIPAQMATPDAINFMARHGRGLICLALTKERVEALGLQPMASNNRSRNNTAFTVSIEAREGISTGISAADRARTVAVAIDASHGPDALVSPGHVFPLVAQPGGVLVRAPLHWLEGRHLRIQLLGWLALALVIGPAVYLQFPLSTDEYPAAYQAEVPATGNLVGCT
jgi:3,4-dihydroxy 2-butanone 4-phosphate synthase/GTP cyclohydrolase II